MSDANSKLASYSLAEEVEAALARSENMFRSPRMYQSEATNPLQGMVHWSAGKSLWIGSMTGAALIAGPLTATWGAVGLFFVSAALTICLGHSLGMHRRLVHRSYDCARWLERLLVYLGTLVGLAGPYGIIRQHDIRDWAQRQPACHAYLAHRSSLIRDGWWQLHCEFALNNPPELILEPSVAADPFYRFLERTWRLHQVPLAVIFFYFGGLPFVIWGIPVRVAASVTGHWLIGYFAHNRGPRNFHVEGAGVQGYNIRHWGIVTMGEAWHNNHHAFPGSAKLGLRSGEADPGWWVLQNLERIGLVWNLKTPETLPKRQNLIPLNQTQTL